MSYMDSRFEDNDRQALAGLSSVPAHHRKAHSHGQKSRAVSAKNRYNDQVSKHSKNIERNCESFKDNYSPYTSTASSISRGGDNSRLDQSLCIDGGGGTVDHDDPSRLPEFIGSGGENRIFRVPIREAVHPGRPTCLELRPHPLRETQGGKFLRNITCTETQLWVGQECGIRFWKFEDMYEEGCGIGGRVRRGDEDAAPFYESAETSATMCLMVDDGSRMVWSGHRDGRIRSWKMDQDINDSSHFKEGLSWQAHRGPVLAMVMSSYGDLWSGGEGGVIKIWPWESIEKSLSLSSEERHMAALLVERSPIDLRGQVTVNGVCSISSQEVKCLISDNIRAKVWCAGSLSFSLWDAQTRKLVKVFNIDGQIENRVDMPAVHQDQAVEDEMKAKFISHNSKKEKPRSFLQWSRNAIMGAAGAVRRAATKGTGAFVDETRRTEALLLTMDGMIWSGCTNGLLVQWDGNGNRLKDFNYHPCSVLSFCTFGERIYVGYASGIIQLLNLEGVLIAGWVGHSSPVTNLAVGAGYIFSLAAHGGIRGWNINSPGPLDNVIRTELAGKETIYERRSNVQILVGTWNVGQGRPSQNSLMSWLGSAISDVGIVVVGLQEVEMGAGFLAVSAAKETVGLEGSSIGHLWLDAIGKALDEGRTFERTGSRQLAALLVSLWVNKNLRTHVGDVDAAVVPCGFGHAIGNKGGVGLKIRVFDRIICFVNCHLAAHLEAVNRRNADFDHIYQNMLFSRSSNLHNTTPGVVSTAIKTNIDGISSVKSSPELSDADMVVFLGDFNYRLFGITYDEARDLVSQRSFDWLREKDQLKAEMKAGKVFQGMREALIKFPPTYKFEKHQAGLGGYDSGEKKRIPAWCDRIIYRDNRSVPVADCSLRCPIASSVLQYEACMEVTDSDHKPVRCKFSVNIAYVDRSVRRKEFGEIVRSNEKVKSILEENTSLPETIVNTDVIILQNQGTFILRITNKCVKDMAIFKIICEGQSTINDGEEPDYCPRGAFGLPRWLEVSPAAGIIKPEQSAEISLHHVEVQTAKEGVDGIPQNWWSEDTQDKEVILVVNVQGSLSIQFLSHRIRVRHSFSAKVVHVDSKSNSSRKNPEFQQLDHSSNTFDVF